MRRYVGKEKILRAAKFDADHVKLLDQIALDEDKYASDVLREAVAFWLSKKKGYKLAA